MPKKEHESLGQDPTPREIYEKLLANKLDFVEVSICSSNSSIVIKNGEEIVFIRTGLDYNGNLVISFRITLQNIVDDPNVRLISERRLVNAGLGIRCEIELASPEGIARYEVVKKGINNKFNYLLIKRLEQKQIMW